MPAARPRPLRDLVDDRRDEIRAIVRSHHGVAVAVFGSVARGDEMPGSDLDFLVELEPDARPIEILSIGVAPRGGARCPGRRRHTRVPPGEHPGSRARRGHLALTGTRPGHRDGRPGRHRDTNRDGPGRIPDRPSVSRLLDVPLALHWAIQGPIRQQLLEHAPHLTCYNSRRHHLLDRPDAPTDQKVGGSSPSERAEHLPWSASTSWPRLMWALGGSTPRPLTPC